MMKTAIAALLLAAITYGAPMNSPSADKIMVNQGQATQQYNRIMEAFMETDSVPTMADIPFPEFYAGSYINDKGNLVVLLRDCSEENQDLFRTITENPNLNFEQAAFTYNDLNAIMNAIDEYLKSRDKQTDAVFANFGGAGVYDDQNKVIVYLNDCSEDKINEFKSNVVDHPAIEFQIKHGRDEYY